VLTNPSEDTLLKVRKELLEAYSTLTEELFEHNPGTPMSVVRNIFNALTLLDVSVPKTEERREEI
jgi:hypothetical protein